MTSTRARVIKARDLTNTEVIGGGEHTPRGRVLPRAHHESSTRAAQILTDARAQARDIVTAAEHAANEVRLQATAQGRADAMEDLLAQHLALGEVQARMDAQHLERSVELARLLAEALIGEALRLDEALVGRIARRILLQLTTREGLQVSVHPQDLHAVAAQLSLIDVQAAQLVPTPGLRRGEICIDTQQGRVEARIEPGLQRLEYKLRSLLSDADSLKED